MTHENYWATQSPVTDPGKAGPAIDELGSDLASLRNTASNLVFHYRADYEKGGVPKERMSEISLRYAAAMFDALLSRGAPTLARDRPPADKVVGCSRDSAVLFLSLARRKGIPARGRVGFTSYDGWWLDHMVVEVWDAARARWRLVDPFAKGAAEAADGDWLDLTEGEFLTGAKAWKAARAGAIGPDRFVIDPEVEVPMLRGWPQLAHNVIHDVAALAKMEMLLWDSWGALELVRGGTVPESLADKLDEISAVLAEPDFEPAALQKLAAQDEVRVPQIVKSPDHSGGPSLEVDVGRVVGK
jgi:hypothetical protein